MNNQPIELNRRFSLLPEDDGSESKIEDIRREAPPDVALSSPSTREANHRQSCKWSPMANPRWKKPKSVRGKAPKLPGAKSHSAYMSGHYQLAGGALG